LIEITCRLIPALRSLQQALEQKAREFAEVRKIGRTHLRDAVPMTLGQEFSGYTRQIEHSIRRIQGAEEGLSELALGGTAVGTGVNTHPDFAHRVIAGIAEETGCPFKEASNHFEAQAAQDAAVETSGALKALAVSLIKIANDIRWLSSGPRCGLGEITIPALQPGSSIMPGKVNPVIPEAVLQVAGQVIGNDAAITFAGQAGNFELNVMLPLIAYNLLQSIDLLHSVVTVLAEKCVQGILADREKCASYLEQSLALATALVPIIGYEKAAAIAKEAHEQGKTVREVALKNQVLPEHEVNRLLDSIVYGKPDE
jgi:fumarate hydratase class II